MVVCEGSEAVIWSLLVRWCVRLGCTSMIVWRVDWLQGFLVKDDRKKVAALSLKRCGDDTVLITINERPYSLSKG